MLDRKPRPDNHARGVKEIHPGTGQLSERDQSEAPAPSQSPSSPSDSTIDLSPICPPVPTAATRLKLVE
jgi:hypothetical protein